MSWLSEWWRKVTGNPKVPAITQTHELQTRSVKLVGVSAAVELVVSPAGKLRVRLIDQDGKVQRVIDIPESI